MSGKGYSCTTANINTQWLANSSLQLILACLTPSNITNEPYMKHASSKDISQGVPSHLGEEFLGMTSDLHGSLCSYMLWEKKKNNVCKCQNFIPLNFNQHIPSENYTFSNIKKNIEQDSDARRSLFSWSILIKCKLTEKLVHQLCREDSLF